MADAAGGVNNEHVVTAVATLCVVLADDGAMTTSCFISQLGMTKFCTDPKVSVVLD